MPTLSARPGVEIKIDGTAVEDQKLVRMRVVQNYDGPNQCDFDFVLPDDDPAAWSPNTYALGSEIEVSMGYEPEFTPVFKGVITRSDGLYGDPNRGQTPRGKIVAHCKLHFLSRIRKTMHWEGVPYSDVIDALAGEAGISPGADATSTTFDYVSVNSQNWLQFATELARRVGFRLSYEDDALVFAAPEVVDSELTAVYGAKADGEDDKITLIKARFKADTAGLHDEVSVLAYDDKEKKQIIGKKAAGDISHGGTEEGVSLLASKFVPSSPLWIKNYAARSQAEVDELAQALIDDIAFDFCTVEGELMGNVGVEAAMTLGIEGVSPNYMGDYYITRVVHEFIADVDGPTAGGFRTRVTGVRQFWEKPA